MNHRTFLLTALFLTMGAGVAAASGGLHMATEWSWARDGGRIFNSFVILGAAAWMAVRFGGPILKNRADTIAARFTSLEEATVRAEAELKEYEAKVAEIALVAEKVRQEAADEAAIVKELIVSQATIAAAKIVAKASAQIALETETARETLRREALGAAVDMAEKILKKTMTANDQEKLVAGYLERMERMN